MKKLLLALLLLCVPAAALALTPSSNIWTSGTSPDLQTSAPTNSNYGITNSTYGQSVPGATYNSTNPATYSATQPQTTGVNSNGTLNYSPLEPLSPNYAFDYQSRGQLSAYLSEAYTVAVTIGALLAVVFLVVGGIRYMLSEAFTDIGSAKKQMWAALWGLLIILGSFLILYTINPNLLTFSLILPSVTQPVNNFQPVTGGGGSGGSVNQNLGDPSQFAMGNPYGLSSMSTSQGIAVRSALGCSQVDNPFTLDFCFASSKYITFYPQNQNDPSVAKAITNYQSDCESFLGNFYLGKVRSIDGSFVGAPGQTAYVCQFRGSSAK